MAKYIDGYDAVLYRPLNHAYMIDMIDDRQLEAGNAYCKLVRQQGKDDEVVACLKAEGLAVLREVEAVFINDNPVSDPHSLRRGLQALADLWSITI